MANLELESVFVVKTFKCAMDGIGIEIKLCHKGTVVDIPKDLVISLENEEYITTGDDVPNVLEEETEENGEEEVVPENTKEHFMENNTKAELVLIIESQQDDEDEKLTGKENKEKLAEICVALFAEDDDED